MILPKVETRIILSNLLADFIATLQAILLPLPNVGDAVRPIRCSCTVGNRGAVGNRGTSGGTGTRCSSRAICDTTRSTTGRELRRARARVSEKIGCGAPRRTRARSNAG
jgi:hypothetical protein